MKTIFRSWKACSVGGGMPMCAPAAEGLDGLSGALVTG